MRRALCITAVIAGIGALVACGAGGPLDTTPSTGDGGDATAPIDASGEVPVTDASLVLEAGPLACASCVVNTCGQQVSACLSDASCVGILECITTTCLAPAVTTGAGPSDAGSDGGDAGDAGRTNSGGGTSTGGGLDTGCFLGCVTKSPTGALNLISVFTCVTGTCGSDCSSTLGGLSGAGGLGGLGGLGSSGGFGKAPIDQDAFREVFAPLVTQR